MYKILAVHTKTVTDGQTKELAIDITSLNNEQEPINVTEIETLVRQINTLSDKLNKYLRVKLEKINNNGLARYNLDFLFLKTGKLTAKNELEMNQKSYAKDLKELKDLHNQYIILSLLTINPNIRRSIINDIEREYELTFNNPHDPDKLLKELKDLISDKKNETKVKKIAKIITLNPKL